MPGRALIPKMQDKRGWRWRAGQANLRKTPTIPRTEPQRMIAMSHIGTLTSPIWGIADNVTDLAFRPGSGAPVLAATGGGGSRLSLFGTDTAGRLGLIDSIALDLGRVPGAQPNAVWLTGPAATVVTPGLKDGLFGGIALGSAGQPLGEVAVTETAGLPANATALHRITLAGVTHYAVAVPGSIGLSLFRAEADGSKTLMGKSNAPASASGAAVDHIISFTLGPQTWLAASSSGGNFVGVYRLTPQGTLTNGNFIDLKSGAGFDGPRDVAMLEVAGNPFLIVAGGNSSSLTVLRVSATGQLQVADHIIDERTTRMQGATGLATVSIDGRGFVLVGGQDDGVSVFTLLPDGGLLHVVTIVDDDRMALAQVSALAATVLGGKILLAVASAVETGLTQLSLDPGPIGLTGHAGAGAQNGTAAGDLLMATAGTTVLNGGAGDDILVTAGGAITLTGGSGRDTFVISQTVGRVVITDFNPAEDRLDLSRTGARSLYDITIQATASGLIIRYRELELVVNSADGRSLQPHVITDDAFPIAHYKPVPLRETLVGTAEADLLQAGAAPTTISGNGGDDTLIGGYYDDILYGGPGNDILIGGPGKDQLFGGPGDDQLFGGEGNDRLSGGPGEDVIWGGPGDDLIWGGPDDDLLYGEEGNDTIRGGAGDDRIFGGPGNDRLYGNAGNDYIEGGPGDDLLDGGIGDDILIGGPGNDRIKGGAGNDHAEGGPGDDRIHMGPGNDFADGGPGNDLIRGGIGHDILYGGEGDDQIYGDAGNDELHGGPGNDQLYGGAGNDILYGDEGDDILYGNKGNDTLYGGEGNDTLYGGPGRDRLIGGPGADLLYGGADADTFVFESLADSRPGSHDRIMDFQSGLDRIDLRALGVSRAPADQFSGKANQLIVVTEGRDTWLHVDADGDRQADFSVQIVGVAGLIAYDLLL